MILAVWTMAVAAGKWKEVAGMAIFTLKHGNAAALCLALQDSPDYSFVDTWHGITMACNILRTMLLEDVFNDTHAQALP